MEKRPARTRQRIGVCGVGAAHPDAALVAAIAYANSCHGRRNPLYYLSMDGHP
jgi:hypothetical protein